MERKRRHTGAHNVTVPAGDASTTLVLAERYPTSKMETEKMTNRHLWTSLACLLLLTLTASAEPAASIQPIQKVAGVQPNRAVFKDAGRKKPLVLKSKEELAKYFGEEQVAKITAKVDLKSQIVLVFAWRGSGGDRLNYDVAESFPEQISFRIKPGRTRDLRPHVHVFALRSNVKWSVK